MRLSPIASTPCMFLFVHAMFQSSFALSGSSLGDAHHEDILLSAVNCSLAVIARTPSYLAPSVFFDMHNIRLRGWGVS